MVPVGSRVDVVSFSSPTSSTSAPSSSSSSTAKVNSSNAGSSTAVSKLGGKNVDEQKGKNPNAGEIVKASTSLLERWFPSLADHAPTGYYASLGRVVARVE